MNLICLVEVAASLQFTCLTAAPLISLFSVSAFGRDVLLVFHLPSGRDALAHIQETGTGC